MSLTDFIIIICFKFLMKSPVGIQSLIRKKNFPHDGTPMLRSRNNSAPKISGCYNGYD